VEAVVDFGAPPFTYEADGAEIFLENRLLQTDGRRPEDGLRSRGDYLVKFILDGPPDFPDYSQVPDCLRPMPEISQWDLDHAIHRSFRFDRSHGAWTINGELGGELETPLTSPSVLGQPEIWHLENGSGGWWHPIHIHSEFGRVLRRNGKEPPLAEHFSIARKDTLLLRDNETVDVFFKFRDFAGPFVFHCHNMEHEDHDMMARFDVVGCPLPEVCHHTFPSCP
jgi:FtsP/CotA-like multicopper oxidase with cupredoxin domain